MLNKDGLISIFNEANDMLALPGHKGGKVSEHEFALEPSRVNNFAPIFTPSQLALQAWSTGIRRDRMCQIFDGLCSKLLEKTPRIPAYLTRA